MITRGVQGTKLLAAPAVIGEAAMLTRSMPELERRSSTFRAMGRACTAWRLSMDDLQVTALDSTPSGLNPQGALNTTTGLRIIQY